MSEDTSDDEGFENEHSHHRDASMLEQPAGLKADDQDAHSQRESSDPEDPHRPNKYSGPAQRWLRWTAADRDVSRSVDLMRARDLSLHLYNVHHLKTRTGDLSRSRGNGSSTGRSWLPKDWAAWPMTAQDVPRSETGIHRGFLVQDDHESASDRSRTDLREILLACITRTARQRFKDRDYQDHDQGLSFGTKEGLSAKSDTVLSSGSVTDSDSGSSSSLEITDQETMQQAQALKMKRSNSDVSSAPLGLVIQEDQNFEPTAMLDDEMAMQIAQPSIEHIISSLEQLLQSLHAIRQRYSNKSKKASSKTNGKQKTNPTESMTVSNGSNLEDESNTKSTSSNKKPKQKYTPKNYGLRSWKDILGTAAILGWNSTALHRASERCSVLFGETMDMPTLDFDRRQIPASGSSKRSANTGLAEAREIVGGVHVDGFMRPIKRRKEWLEVPRMWSEDRSFDRAAGDGIPILPRRNGGIEIQGDGQTENGDSDGSQELEDSSNDDSQD